MPIQYRVLAVLVAHTTTAIPFPLLHPRSSFIRINLRPHLLYALPLLLGLLPVLRRPLEAQPPQAHVDLVLCVGAVARYFPEEAACVAFVEGCDDFGAGCRWSVSWTGKDGSGRAYSSGLLRCGDGDAL
jgi:hypothetical protein